MLCLGLPSKQWRQRSNQGLRSSAPSVLQLSSGQLNLQSPLGGTANLSGVGTKTTYLAGSVTGGMTCFQHSHSGFSVTSHCTQDGHFSIAVSRKVTSPPLLLNSVRLAFRNDHECTPVMATRTFALFWFPFNSCGTTRRVRTVDLWLCS